MKLYINKADTAAEKLVAVDDMILTKDLPTTAGSMMLENYKSLFEAEVVTKLKNAGYEISGKANVGEMAIDLLGETSYFGECTDEAGNLASAAAEIVKTGEVKACLTLDVNGTPRRAAALADLFYIKPTYGVVSRYGTIPAACSGETVGVMAKCPCCASEVLSAILGHDDKDGTSLSDEKCAVLDGEAAAPKKVAIATALLKDIDAETAKKIEAAKAALTAAGIEVCEIDGTELTYAKAAWNVLMSSELTNNVSRYEGVKYGYRSPNYKNIDELYTNSRTEAFGELLKTAILYGSENLSDDNYMPVYDKSLRVRRVVVDYFAGLFEKFDAVMMPACSKSAYTKADTDANIYLAFDEALYTAPASISGLPAVIAGGVQLVGKAFGEKTLITLAKMMKEGK